MTGKVRQGAAGVAAMARAGARVVVDDVFLGGATSQERWQKAFGGLDGLWVGVRCESTVAAGREVARGGRVRGSRRSGPSATRDRTRRPGLSPGAGMVDHKYGRNRAWYSVVLAETHMRQGHVDGACEVARDTLPLIAEVSSTRTTARLANFRRHVEQHKDLPVVRDFLSESRDLVA